MSFTVSSILSIAGAPNDGRWKKLFTPHVTREGLVGGKSVPLEGSVGIHFHVREDLQALHSRLDGNQIAIADHLRATVKREGKPITKRSIEQVLAFLDFALGDQPLFFLRQGCSTLGLYRKTRGYYYSPDRELCHRVAFEFVRLANEKEIENFHLGVRPQTVLKVSLYQPVQA